MLTSFVAFTFSRRQFCVLFSVGSSKANIIHEGMYHKVVDICRETYYPSIPGPHDLLVKLFSKLFSSDQRTEVPVLLTYEALILIYRCMPIIHITAYSYFDNVRSISRSNSAGLTAIYRLLGVCRRVLCSTYCWKRPRKGNQQGSTSYRTITTRPTKCYNHFNITRPHAWYHIEQ